MKTTKIYSKIVMTVAILLSSVIAFAQTFEVVNSNRSNLELSLKIDKFALEDSNVDGVEGQSIVLNGIFLHSRNA